VIELFFTHLILSILAIAFTERSAQYRQKHLPSSAPTHFVSMYWIFASADSAVLKLLCVAHIMPVTERAAEVRSARRLRTVSMKCWDSLKRLRFMSKHAWANLPNIQCNELCQVLPVVVLVGCLWILCLGWSGVSFCAASLQCSMQYLIMAFLTPLLIALTLDQNGLLCRFVG